MLGRLVMIVLVATAVPLNVAAVHELRDRPAHAVRPELQTAGLQLLAPPSTTTTTAAPLEPGQAAPGRGAAIPVTVPSPDASCPPAVVAVTVATGQPSYLLGEAVIATTTIVNRSSQACEWPDTVSFMWTDAYGETIQDGTTDPQPPAVRWLPGQTRTETDTWNQQVGPGEAAIAGPATIGVTWSDAGGDVYSAEAAFTIIDPTTSTTTPGPTA